jgi:hypothetical protein
MAVLGESTGGLSPIQHQVLHKQQAKSEIVQVYTKCSYTHVMAATSYPTSHPRLHPRPQPQPHLNPTLTRTQSISSTAEPSTSLQRPTSHQPRGAPPSPDPCLCPHARGGAGSPHAPEPRSVCATRRRRHSARVNGARYTRIYSDPIDELRLRKQEGEKRDKRGDTRKHKREKRTQHQCRPQSPSGR